MKRKNCIAVFFLLALFISCTSTEPSTHQLPRPEDTSSRDIEYQLKTEYVVDGVYADNQFDGARLNDFKQVSSNRFRATVKPENEPINESAYFAFRMRADKLRNINLEIEYPEHVHRYVPKISRDAISWTALDSTQFDTLKAGNLLRLKLKLDTSYTYVSAQEIQNSSDNKNWIDTICQNNEDVSWGIAGESSLGRNIYYLDIGKGSKTGRPSILIFSRMHPPEVSGYKAMQSFVETLLDTSALSLKFREKYRVLVYPMINPDGVDLGHWRHNAGGVDLNRDWSHYRQQECHVVAHHSSNLIRSSKCKVVLGLDFHSTQEDVYYTLTDNRQSEIFGFKDIWLEAIDLAFEEYTPNDAPFDLEQPISKAWFFLEFGAEGIIYEVGDETDRDFIKDKAMIAAREMMKLLVLR